MRSDLEWWLDNANLLRGSPLQSHPPDLLLFTDVSKEGWGVHLLQHLALGLWSNQECKIISMCWNFKLPSWHSSTSAQFIPGKWNIVPDNLNRTTQIVGSEWSLAPWRANKVLTLAGSTTIDLFATALNRKLQIYCSPVPDLAAAFEDVFQHPWDSLDIYAFPPFCLIRQVLNQVRSAPSLAMMLVALKWPHVEWYPDLLLLLVETPRGLPPLSDILCQPHVRIFHNAVSFLHLYVWRLSSSVSQRSTFHERLQQQCQDTSGSPQRLSIRPSGPSSVVGVVREAVLLSEPLSP
ncbi:uncharacterized protein LOC135214543 [Macrobrachium nipponense]|uniref:uncharacterized protein LOC135214543 n=1 Tax=Macrobrachium nipponense TaxID=159736 RepID=UPI0030C88F52